MQPEQEPEPPIIRRVVKTVTEEVTEHTISPSSNPRLGEATSPMKTVVKKTVIEETVTRNTSSQASTLSSPIAATLPLAHAGKIPEQTAADGISPSRNASGITPSAETREMTVPGMVPVNDSNINCNLDVSQPTVERTDHSPAENSPLGKLDTAGTMRREASTNPEDPPILRLERDFPASTATNGPHVTDGALQRISPSDPQASSALQNVNQTEGNLNDRETRAYSSNLKRTTAPLGIWRVTAEMDNDVFQFRHNAPARKHCRGMYSTRKEAVTAGRRTFDNDTRHSWRNRVDVLDLVPLFDNPERWEIRYAGGSLYDRVVASVLPESAGRWVLKITTGFFGNEDIEPMGPVTIWQGPFVSKEWAVNQAKIRMGWEGSLFEWEKVTNDFLHLLEDSNEAWVVLLSPPQDEYTRIEVIKLKKQ